MAVWNALGRVLPLGMTDKWWLTAWRVSSHAPSPLKTIAFSGWFW